MTTAKKKKRRPRDQSRPELRLEWVEAGSLTPNPRNWRRHPGGQTEALKHLIHDDEVGWAGALLYNERTKQLIDGHARLAVVGHDTVVPVLIGSWSERAEAKILATLDTLTGMAEPDAEQLQALIDEVDLSDDWFADLQTTIDGLLEEAVQINVAADEETEVVEDTPPEPPDEATTQPGDVWLLGPHRVMCGDSGSPEDLDTLLEGQPVDLVNTDPPYNVNVEPRSNNAIAAGLSSFPPGPKEMHIQSSDLARHPGKSKRTHTKLRAKDRPLQNDFVSDDDFDKMLRAWFGNIGRTLRPGHAFYIWGGYANWANYCAALAEHELYFSQGITWVKQHPVLGRKDFMNDCEHAWYGWRSGKGHKFHGPNNISNVWVVKKVNPTAMVHLTEKPVELAARAAKYSSARGETVLDLFGGSGSTLMACEQLERKARLMELDPLYVDVIVRRWETFTGRKAERISGDRDRAAATNASARE